MKHMKSLTFFVIEIVAKLIGHNGLVKGVTWDPVGQYLASQSDDKSLRIWRTKDWKEQACITEPFKEVCSYYHTFFENSCTKIILFSVW